MRNLPLKRLPAHVPMRALFMLALVIAALAVIPLAHPAQAHAADPVTLTVTKATDTDEEGTLRWALGKVNLGEAARIEFDTTAMVSSVIELGKELPTIVSSVEIAGPVGGVTIKKASTAVMPGGWRHLRINTPAFKVSVSNVAFEGPGAQGAVSNVENGGIYADSGFAGTLELADCTFKNNFNGLGSVPGANVTSRGGAIHVLGADAELRMTRCVVQGNTAYSFGGGVYSLSPLYAKDCSFLGNFSKSDSAGGGALLSTEKAELTGCIVDGNHSDEDSGGVQSSALTMTDCTVTNNTAGAPGALSTGGGVGAVDLVMTDCEVTGNSCLFSGGGIYASTSATITESTVSGNNSDGIGGGAFIARKGVVQSSEIVDNTSSNAGAGVIVGDETEEHEASTLEVADSTIKGNKSLDSGGGMFLYDNCALTLTNATVSQNEADFSGGGVCGEMTASLVMTGGQITGNKAGASGGGVLLETGDASLERCVVSENTAVDSGGGLIVRALTARDVRLSRNVAGAEGGGARVAASLEASGSTFDGNEANVGGALVASVVALTNCTVSGNTAQEEGGGVAGLEVELLNCTVSGNTSGAATALEVTGGGVLANKLSMFGCIVAGNYDANGNRNELAVGTTVDNGDGTVSDSHGKKNIVGIPASGLQTILETETVQGRTAGALKDNGGPTPTIMIALDGPAQDMVASDDYAVPSTDQRGGKRPFGAAGDIGAVEVFGLNVKYDVAPFAPYQGDGKPLSGKVSAPLRSVLGVTMGGTDLKPGADYALSEGSTVVTLTPAFLKSLKNGSYEVVVSFTNGTATLPLTVEVPGPEPVKPINQRETEPTVLARTGDGVDPRIWAFAGGAALATMIGAAVGNARRRRS